MMAGLAGHVWSFAELFDAALAPATRNWDTTRGGVGPQLRRRAVPGNAPPRAVEYEPARRVPSVRRWPSSPGDGRRRRPRKKTRKLPARASRAGESLAWL